MSENFSKDMPAYPIREEYNLEAIGTGKESVLIQRWWDIKEPGFFSKNLGTVMMSINVYAVPENTRKKIHNSPYNVQDRVDLILILDELILNNCH